MILINLKKNKNEKMPNAFGKYYAFPVINQTIGMDGLSEHMASHNTPFSAGQTYSTRSSLSATTGTPSIVRPFALSSRIHTPVTI